MKLNLAFIIHDVKNRLATIASCSEAPTEDEVRNIKKMAMESSAKLSNILDIHNIETNHIEVNKSPVDVIQFMQDLYFDIKPFTSKTLHLVMPEVDAVVMLDGVIIKDALVNAVQNADRYAKEKITLKGDVMDHLFIIEVIDDGPGFDLSKPPDNTGIGLELSKLLIEHHGSKLDLLSDHGAIFRISISI